MHQSVSFGAVVKQRLTNRANKNRQLRRLQALSCRLRIHQNARNGLWTCSPPIGQNDAKYFILLNQEPAFRAHLKTPFPGAPRVLSYFLTPILFLVDSTFPRPTNYPWVSEAVGYLDRQRQKRRQEFNLAQVEINLTQLFYYKPDNRRILYYGGLQQDTRTTSYYSLQKYYVNCP